MRSAIVCVAIGIACALPGCSHTVCTIAVNCGPLTEPFDVPFSGTTESLHEARFELCRDDGCITTTMGADGASASCRPFVTEAPTTCSRTGDGPIVVDDRGALGGTIRVRIFRHTDDGGELLLAEHSVTMVREEYESTSQPSCADPKECVRYVPR